MDELNLRNVTCLLIDVRGKNGRTFPEHFLPHLKCCGCKTGIVVQPKVTTVGKNHVGRQIKGV